MTRTRPAILAGSWYEADPDRLRARLEAWLGEFPTDPEAAPPVFLLVPHAGHMWSGRIAAASFAQLRDRDVRRIILIAPSHRVGFHGIAVPNVDAEGAETPLGAVAIDGEGAARLREEGGVFTTRDDAMDVEHAIEVQLPFVAAVTPGATVLPLVCGSLSTDEIEDAGARLRDLVDDTTVVVASGDLTHYGLDYGFAPFGRRVDAARVESLDRGGLAHVLAGDVRGWLDYRERHDWSACATGPVAVGLAALTPGARGEIIAYDTSGRIGGDDDRSVSYAAVELRDDRPRIPADLRAAILATARAAVHEAAGVAPASAPPAMDPSPGRGVFVTMHREGKLRGCMGRLTTDDDLLETVRAVARLAALDDPRFPPLRAAETEGLELDVSVLSPMRRVSSIGDVVVGLHGLLVEHGDRRGLLLPQVATEHGLDAAAFLDATLQKAGIAPPLPPDATLHVFSATVVA